MSNAGVQKQGLEIILGQVCGRMFERGGGSVSHPAREERRQYCYGDYLKLPQDKKYEIIDGVLYAMAPAPSTQHQRVLRNLLVWLANCLKDTDCEVLSAPYDVLLPEGSEDPEDVKTVVQPDILVVCDKSKLKEKYCLGAPDFIIEIVSPSRPSIDYVKKLHLYEKHKVREYWIVDYTHQQVMSYRLESEEYGSPEVHTAGELVSAVLGLTIPLKDIFQ